MTRAGQPGDQGFWARRRAGLRAEEAAEAAALAARQEAALRAEAEAREAALAGRGDAEILAELGLPDPDTLGKGDDFAVYLRAALPERIRRRALRRLWTSNPVLANLDGLVDHGEDFTDAATVVPRLATVYQVGRGLVGRLAEGGGAEVAQPEPAPVAMPDVAMPETVAAAEPGPQVQAASVPVPAPAGSAEAPRAPRHMRFAFTS